MNENIKFLNGFMFICLLMLSFVTLVQFEENHTTLNSPKKICDIHGGKLKFSGQYQTVITREKFILKLPVYECILKGE